MIKIENIDAYEKMTDGFRYFRPRREEQFDVAPKTPDSWENNRILVSLDGIKCFVA